MSIIEKVVCKRCEQAKYPEDFYKDKRSKNGLSGRCKDCVKYCAKESQNRNKEHRKEYMKKYAQENRDKIIAKRRIYVETNREYFSNYSKTYHYNRRLKDDLHRLKHNVRNRLWCAFKKSNWKKEGSVKLLGADYQTVMRHIESLFVDRMSWDNYGRCVDGDCHNYWHIDHIIPLNTAKNKEELEALCHYTNLQPLWAIDNLSKPKR